MVNLRDYQEKYSSKLKNTVDELINTNDQEVCVFQAPTGSGKTLMVSEFLRRFVKERSDNKTFSFVWISVRKIHSQSKEKLEQYYEDDGTLKCSYFNDLIDKKINENEILFINWESINKKDKNTIIKENEQDFYLESVINNTKEDGRLIILIIDESHHTASSEKSKELISVIGPKVTIEVSATPQLHDVSAKIKVPLDEVIKEEMIKKEVTVNPEFKNLKITSKNENEIVIKQALDKREELLSSLKKEKSEVNPLLLIQLPDKTQVSDDKKDEVISILKKYKITEENGKLAIWLSEEKSETLANIEKYDNDVEVLIFKQAIALGWDCPRAYILVVFREYSSFEFTIQTIGRIMRMPELLHYDNDELNKGFVFTNLPNINLEEDYVKDYLTVYESKRKDSLYSKIKLLSIHFRRQRERTRLSSDFIKIFLEVAKAEKLKDKLNLKPKKLMIPLISDGIIKNIDKPGDIEKETFDIEMSEHDIFQKFDTFVKKLCSPYAPHDSSDRLKSALYTYFNKEFNFEKYDLKVQKIILSEDNVIDISHIIIKSKDKYAEKVKQLSEKREIEKTEEWEVPSSITYTKKNQTSDFKLSIMEPLYLKSPSMPENNFMIKLSESKKIMWWFKNGESETKFFAVKYIDEKNIERPFYVDFIIQYKDGRIGLFDTKKGMTAKEAGPRAKGLFEYIQSQNKKGKNLIGGIVIEKDNVWLYNEGKDYNPDNLSNWKIVEF
ncbi:MAG: DEAD/DEAH box helicase family protein [Candidatus Nanoarchaeia archaeon]|jgi:type III restriction enzyme